MTGVPWSGENDAVMPRDRDLVVRQEPDRGGRFSVSELPGPVQFFSSSCEEAVRIAKGYAQRQRVDVWYVNGHGDTYHRIAGYRALDN